MRWESPAEKVSIAVVSSQCGAVCRGRPRAAVEYSRTQLSSSYSHCQWLTWQGGDGGELRTTHFLDGQKVCPSKKRQGLVFILDWWVAVKLYLVQVRHEVLVERADQHVEGPLTLLGKRWRLQCGFLSIDYCQRRRTISLRKTQLLAHFMTKFLFFFFLHLTNKKSLNSWWSVNTGGDGRGGPNSGTLSSEKIFNLWQRADI